MTSKRQIIAAEYDRLATAALALAESSSLEHVRDKHRRAAAAWADLALRQHSRVALAASAQTSDVTPSRAKSLFMSSDEKLAAVQRGDPGSYNFWAPLHGDSGQAHFQRLVSEARETARTRAYFHRYVSDQALGTAGLLITIQSH